MTSYAPSVSLDCVREFGIPDNCVFFELADDFGRNFLNFVFVIQFHFNSDIKIHPLHLIQ